MKKILIFLVFLSLILTPTQALADGFVRNAFYFPIILNSPEIYNAYNIGGHISSSSSCQYLIKNSPYRIFVRWDLIEPTRGTYNFNPIDSIINTCNEHELLISVTNTPEWARRLDLMGLISAEPKQENYIDYVNLIKALLDKYSEIKYIEVWNEPDVDPTLLMDGTWWMGAWGWTYLDGVRYANFFNYVVNNLPNNNFVAGALHLEKKEFLQGFLNTVNVDYFGLSYHSYDKYSGHNVWINKYNLIKSLTNKRLFVTETMLITNPGEPTSELFELEQSNYLNYIYTYTNKIYRIYLFTTYQCSTWRNDETVNCNGKKPIWYTWFNLYEKDLLGSFR